MEQSVAEKLYLGQRTVTLGLPWTKTVLIIQRVTYRASGTGVGVRGERDRRGIQAARSSPLLHLDTAYFTAPRVSSPTVLPSVFPSQSCPF